MVWKNIKVKCEKIKFIGDWLNKGYSFSILCKKYGISRKTGYKLIKRYEVEGEKALEERSHRRHYHPNKTDAQRTQRIIELKHRYPLFGPEKLRDWLMRNEPETNWPAISTVGEVLKRHGLVKPRRNRKQVSVYSQPFLECDAPNNIWSADFKGQFRLGKTKVYCYPLTVSDNYSRFLLMCEGLESPTLRATMKCFEKAFAEYGLPDAIRTDNGQPFASVGIGGLTQLSIWWIKLGIVPERIEPGHPEQNGRHERMHRTLKEATALPSRDNFAEQQNCFDEFRQIYNYERSHQGLDGKRPGDVYCHSLRSFPNKTPEIFYPSHFEIRKVRTNGQIKWGGKKYFVSELLRGEALGFEQIDEERVVLYFSNVKLGLIDRKENKLFRL